MMDKDLTITTERVDEIPLLLALMEKMDLPSILDEHFPTHGNWEGISFGWTSVIWLSHILSLGDHRLNHVQEWAEKHLETLCRCTGQEVRALDFSDDRLEEILDALSDDSCWQEFEAALNQHTIRVYELDPNRVRLDSTSAKGYWSVTEEGLFQFGHSKDHRPDLPQVKVMLSSLDPLGMPVATQVLPGNRADDPLYIPAVAQVREGVKRRGLLYVGDCKMASFQTRAYIQAGGDFYLCPLPAVQLSDAELEAYLSPVWSGEQELSPVYREKLEGGKEQVAEGYEREELLEGEFEGEKISWKERRLVIRSLQQAKISEVGLRTRIEKAKAKLEALNEHRQGKERFEEVEELRQAAEAIVKKYRVERMLNLSYEEVIKERMVRRYRGRPAGIRVEKEIRLRVEINEEEVKEAIKRLGWRVYATNQPGEQLSLAQAILAYRNEYVIERSFGRLKGKPLSLTPMYLQSDARATGLVRLLSIGLRVLSLLEFTVRRRLAARNEKLSGLYAGNPKRSTARPTAEAMLEAFKDINLTIINTGGQIQRHLTPLSDLQQRILMLLDLPLDIYAKLATNFSQPP